MLASPKLKSLIRQVVLGWQKWDEYEGEYYVILPKLLTNPNLAGSLNERTLFRDIKNEWTASAGQNVDDINDLVTECRVEIIEEEHRAQERHERAHFERQSALASHAGFASEREEAFKQLEETLQTDFLEVDILYKELWKAHIVTAEFEERKSTFIQFWIRENLKQSAKVPDEEQAAAIAAVTGHVQVVARAGSGKTTTLVQRAVFLQKHCGVPPEQMLLLAFNSKAAADVQEKLFGHLGEDAPNAMTFHALAHGLVQPDRVLVDEARAKRTEAVLSKILSMNT